MHQPNEDRNASRLALALLGVVALGLVAGVAVVLASTMDSRQLIPVPGSTPTPAPSAAPSATPATSATPTATPGPPSPDPLAIFNYHGGLGDWRVVQEPEGTQRMTTGAAPRGIKGFRPSRAAMRVELRHGDVTVTGDYSANRAEVYDRIATRGTSATSWPDPIGSVRWYGFSILPPRHFCLSGDSAKWFVFTQWKGLDGGSPPIAMEMRKGQFLLGGKHAHRYLGAVRPGRWTRFVVGIRFSPDPSQGWVQVFRDGKLVVPRRPAQTQDAYYDDDTKTRKVDPTYLKQGIYRSGAWQCTQVLYFGPTIIADNAAALRRQRF